MTGKAPEVTATSVQAAADASQDAVAMYKKKLFYRRLKVIVIGFIALALLLSGCLLGFVLPASIHEDPNVANDRAGYNSANQLIMNESLPDANSTINPATNVPSSTLITILKNLSVAYESSTARRVAIEATAAMTTTKAAESTTTTVVPTSTTEETTVEITSTEPTTTSASRKQTTSKWWLVKFQDRISGVKWKHSPHRTSTTTTTTTTRPPVQTTTSDSPVYKWWLLHWKEHVENAIQKNKMRGNHTTRINATRPPAGALVGNERSEIVETTSGSWDDIKNQLTGNIFRTNQTGKSNVRSVTSYAQQNITTTMPSVVTRKVEVE